MVSPKRLELASEISKNCSPKFKILKSIISNLSLGICNTPLRYKILNVWLSYSKEKKQSTYVANFFP